MADVLGIKRVHERRAGEDDLLDFAREELGFDVHGIDELAIALEYAGIELSVPRSM